MWIENFSINNIKCFQNFSLRLGNGKRPYPWITLLGENGGGKSTALQALGLMLAGPEGAQKLMSRPVGWLRDESKVGKISVRIHQGENDPGKYGEYKQTKAFGYTFHITGSNEILLRNKIYTEPTISESVDAKLTWLRRNAFSHGATGWFCAGYGAFRRLTRKNQIIVPALEPQSRYANFATQFNEDEALSAFERWVVYLDYKIAKTKDQVAQKQKDIGINAINALLPRGEFKHVTPEGKICFDIDGITVPTLALSDGYRSILALAGDLVWQLINSFPNSNDPLSEEGIVLIDEIDIHLHPLWQRNIAKWLRNAFPNIQFIVATHSPLIAAGAGEDAITYKIFSDKGEAKYEKIENLAWMDVDRILKSPAFGLVSTFSLQAQEKLYQYDQLLRKKNKTPDDTQKLTQLSLLFGDKRLFGNSDNNPLENKIEQYIAKSLK